MARDESYRLEDWRRHEVWYEVEVRTANLGIWDRSSYPTFKHEAAAEAFIATLVFLRGFSGEDLRVARYFRDTE